jgi:hypothetical protein
MPPLSISPFLTLSCDLSTSHTILVQVPEACRLRAGAGEGREGPAPRILLPRALRDLLTVLQAVYGLQVHSAVPPDRKPDRGQGPHAPGPEAALQVPSAVYRTYPALAHPWRGRGGRPRPQSGSGDGPELTQDPSPHTHRVGATHSP